MNCPTCGNDTPEDSQFCGGCGTNLISGEASVGTELPMVGFGEAISRGFRNYFNFSGRATRAEYWWWGLFIVLVSIVLQVVDTLFGEVGQWVSLLVQLAVLLPSLALGARRLHDINRAGWWQLLWFVLLIGGIVLIVWAIKRGDKGPNKYGPGPRQATSTIEKLLLITLVGVVGIWLAFGMMFT
jgi:uncharacterized membrane protein YhaH (DUF805 family)